jgi:hypothetical protein
VLRWFLVVCVFHAGPQLTFRTCLPSLTYRTYGVVPERCLVVTGYRHFAPMGHCAGHSSIQCTARGLICFGHRAQCREPSKAVSPHRGYRWVTWKSSSFPRAVGAACVWFLKGTHIHLQGRLTMRIARRLTLRLPSIEGRRSPSAPTARWQSVVSWLPTFCP